jgi:hypothetical protein
LVALSGTADERKGADALIKLLKLNSNKVNCMIHIDDISALDEKHNLYLSGYGTSPDWDMAMGSIEKNFVTHRIISGEIGENNHINFYKKGIPVLNIFTKRTSDNVSVNRSGVELISASIGDMVLELDNLPKLLFSQTKPINDYRKAKFKVSLGVEPDLESGKVGVLVGAVKKGSPAEYSNIKPGDVIIRIDGHDVLDINDYITELSKFNGGDRIMIQVKRNGEAKQMLIAFK